MRRFAFALMFVLLASTLNAPATTVGPASIAPYTARTGLGSAVVNAPCTTKPSPVAARTPAPATGRIDGTLGVDVAGCTLSKETLDVTWRVADSPADLIGKRATVLLVFLFDAAYSHASGTASHVEASYHLIVGNNDRIVVSSTCDHNSCLPYGTTVGPVSAPMGITYDSLPASIDLLIHREARVEDGTGTAWVDVTGTLEAVLIRAAD